MAKWIPTWRYVPIDYACDIGALEDTSQIGLFSNNIAGTRLRLRFNNLGGIAPMVIHRAAVALYDRDTGALSLRMPVTLEGREEIVVPPGERPYSDPVPAAVTARQDILVYLYFRERTAVRCVCTTATGVGWQSVHRSGNIFRTEALGFTVKSQLVPVLAEEPFPLQFVAGLCEISVLAAEDVELIALFGDSVTHMSFFMDPFLELLQTRFPGRYALMNAGIAGNRVQKPFPRCPELPDGGHRFGIAGRDRFRADVCEAGPDIVFVMEGVNDCSHSLCFGEPEVPDARDIFRALADVAAQAHGRGSRVYLSTVAPFGAFGEPWRDGAEALRQSLNALIRAGGVADGVVDMDAVLRDPADPHRMRAGLHLGDGVHPNWHGGVRMAQALAQALFP